MKTYHRTQKADWLQLVVASTMLILTIGILIYVRSLHDVTRPTTVDRDQQLPRVRVVR